MEDPVHQARGFALAAMLAAALAARGAGPAYYFTTLAGSPVAGSADGVGTTARFNQPNALVVDDDGSVFVADTQNRTIRRIAAGWHESPALAGDSPGWPTRWTGSGSQARLPVADRAGLGCGRQPGVSSMTRASCEKSRQVERSRRWPERTSPGPPGRRAAARPSAFLGPLGQCDRRMPAVADLQVTESGGSYYSTSFRAY